MTDQLDQERLADTLTYHEAWLVAQGRAFRNMGKYPVLVSVDELDEIIAGNPLIFDRDSMQKMAHYLLGESG